MKYSEKSEWDQEETAKSRKVNADYKIVLRLDAKYKDELAKKAKKDYISINRLIEGLIAKEFFWV